MDELKQAIKEANIKIVDIDSIVEISFNGLALSKSGIGKEMLDKQELEKNLEKFLARKEIFLEFGYDAQEIDVFLAKNIERITPNTKLLTEKLLIMENFYYLEKALMGKDIFRYSNNLLYAAFCLKKKIQISENKSPAVASIISRPELFGYTTEKLIEDYPLTEDKMKLMEKIHNVKKKAKTKSGGVSL